MTRVTYPDTCNIYNISLSITINVVSDMGQFPKTSYFYTFRRVHLQNPTIGGKLFPTPSGGRRPLEMKLSSSYPVDSEYIWL